MNTTTRIGHLVSVAAAAAFLVALVPSDADARRGGGSMGGRGGFSSGRSSGGGFSGSRGLTGGGVSDSSYRGGYRSYGGGPGLFLCLGGPSMGPVGGGGGGGCGDSSVAGIVVVMLVVFGVFIALKAAKARRELKQGGGFPALSPGDEGSGELCSVARLSVAFLASEAQLQRDLQALAESGRAGTTEGDAFVIRETSVLMTRSRDAMVRFAWKQDSPVSDTRARALLEEHGNDLRSRFDEEEIRGDEGGVRKRAGDREDKDVAEFIVVSMVVAFRTPAVKTEPKDAETAVAVIREIGGIGPDRLLGMEVIWDPVSPDEELTAAGMDRSYADLLPL